MINYLRERRLWVSRPNRSALKPLNTAKALVFTDEFNGWGWIDEVEFDGRFPIKIVYLLMPGMVFIVFF